MLTARKYQNRASKLVILSIGSQREGNAFGLPVPREIGAVRRSFKARNGKFESISFHWRVCELWFLSGGAPPDACRAGDQDVDRGARPICHSKT